MPGTKTTVKSWKNRSRSANEMETHDSRRNRGATVSTERDRRETVQPIPTPKSPQPSLANNSALLSTERDQRETLEQQRTPT